MNARTDDAGFYGMCACVLALWHSYSHWCPLTQAGTRWILCAQQIVIGVVWVRPWLKQYQVQAFMISKVICKIIILCKNISKIICAFGTSWHFCYNTYWAHACSCIAKHITLSLAVTSAACFARSACTWAFRLAFWQAQQLGSCISSSDYAQCHIADIHQPASFSDQADAAPT